MITAFFATVLLLQTAPAPVSATESAPARVELVESWPRGTDLDHADLRDARDVWVEVFDAARATIDLAHFYASDDPAAPGASALEPVLAAIERAAARGVQVRGLFDAKFQKTYPDTIARIGRAPGAVTRLLDLAPVTGGVLHAKYFVVDGQRTFIGSQNFDWRALEHIQELGVLVDSEPFARAVLEVYELDWRIAGGDPDARATSRAADGFPLAVAGGTAAPVSGPASAEAGRITPVYSPADLCPDPRLWDLPRIVALIDGAQSSVRIQLLTYRMTSRDGTYFAEIENALRRAAARGARVELLLADWCKRKWTIEGLQALEPLPNVAVKLVTIPQDAAGFVPFARVAHAKYLVVDGRAAWLGTSNWEQSYFESSRNVGLLIEGGALPARLDAYFAAGWNGPYATAVDPCATYAPPRIGE